MEVEPIASLYFVRHGRSTHNESDEDRPIIWDAPLHGIGIRQAALLRERLKDIPLEVVVSSPLTRALQTALIALGDWRMLAAGSEVICKQGRARLKRLKVATVRVDDTGVRFDVSDGETEPVDSSCLGPSSKVRLLHDVQLKKSGCQQRGSICTVTNVAVSLTDDGEFMSCLEAFPAQTPRCRIVAWPEATEELHESDDLGSPANDLRQRFPTVDFSRLPSDGATWWFCDEQLPLSLDALTARDCWLQHGRKGPKCKTRLYDEPEENLQKRISKLVQDLNALASHHTHIALFAHRWVLEEIWCSRFGISKSFANAELALVDVLPGGEWRFVQGDDSSDSS